MSKKQPDVEKAKVNEEVKEEKAEKKDDLKWGFGVAPSLLINMVREARVYRFEMPIGAKLDECEEACLECVNVVKKMIEEALKKQEEAKKEKSESTNEDLKDKKE